MSAQPSLVLRRELNLERQSNVYSIEQSDPAVVLKIVSALAKRQESLHNRLNPTVVPRDWQISAAAELMSKRDVIVVTATGSGKSLCYQSALVSAPGKIILGIFPLLSLMTDQIQSAERFGIRACRITHSTLLDDPNLLKDIGHGKYELVCLGPEFAIPENKQFSSLLRSPHLRQSLLGIVVDECHLCYVWNLFRPQYSRLGVLRVLFPEVPIMALSATLSPHVLCYTQSVLRLNRPTGLVKRSIDRPNILLYCLPILHSINSRKDLLFLVPTDITLQTVRQLPKTMVFMDSRQAVCDMTTTLIGRLPLEYRSADIVCDYSTALSESRRHNIMEKFISGECRILICTEAAGMGIDVADVVRVIQWTIPRQLNLASFWQRAGRGGRNRQLQAIAILFYKKAQRIPGGVEHPLKLFCESPDSPMAYLVLKKIRAFDAGAQNNKEKGAIDLEAELQPEVMHEVEGSSDETGLQRNPATTDLPADPIMHSENAGVRSGSGNYEGGGEIQLQPMNLQDSLLLGDPNEENVAIGAFGQNPTLTNPESSHAVYSGSTRGDVTLRTMDRGLLWLLSTTGCRRKVIRMYFDDTDILPFTPVVQAPPPDLGGQPGTASTESFPFPCCDNCLGLNQDTDFTSICVLLPPDPKTVAANSDQTPAPINTEAAIEHGESPELRISKPVSKAHRKLLKAKLEEFRELVWIREGLNKPFGVIVPIFFLQNQHITTLVSRAGSINSIDALAKVLARHKIDLQFSAIGPYAHELLDAIVSTIAIELPKPQLMSQQHLPVDTPSSSHQAAAATISTQASSTGAAIRTPDQLLSRALRLRNTVGRPTRALREEQARLEADITIEAQIRFSNAEAAGLDSSRWNLSLIGRRRRGRPSFIEQQAREQAEAGRQEIIDSLLNTQDFPLLWARAQDSSI